MEYHNVTIASMLAKKNEDTGKPLLLTYNPHTLVLEILYTNIILRKILGDDYFEWCDPKSFRHPFGKPQYYNGNNIDYFPFAKLPVSNDGWFNEIPNGMFPYENIGITNVWMVINNPGEMGLDDIFASICVSYGPSMIQRYNAEFVENQIDVMAHILGVDGVFYKNKKIYVPILAPHNGFFLNNTLHGAIIDTLEKGFGGDFDPDPEDDPRFGGVDKIFEFEVWGNICDMNTFPALAKTSNLEHYFTTVFYHNQFNGDNCMSNSPCLLSVRLERPAYALYITNIAKERVKCIRLFMGGSKAVNGKDVEYVLNDIEWVYDGAIIWFNRNFLYPDETNNTFNFSSAWRSSIFIEHTYTHPFYVQLEGIMFEGMHHYNGISGIMYGDK